MSRFRSRLTGSLSDLLDAETGQRGYLLTGEERYLQPYNDAVKAAPGELAHLKELLAARPEEATGWNRLRQAVDQKFEELRRTVDLRRQAGLPPALDIVLSDQGKRLMDEIRQICFTIEEGENASRNAASQEGEGAAQTALLVTTGGARYCCCSFSRLV